MPATAGGPPVRGDLLPLWVPDGPVDPVASYRWARAALRVAIGIQVIAHFPAIVQQPQHVLAFCAGSAASAAELAEAIRLENVDAQVGTFHPDGSGVEPCDVRLPCRPEATVTEVDHAVLAVVKAAHPLECLLPGPPPA